MIAERKTRGKTTYIEEKALRKDYV